MTASKRYNPDLEYGIFLEKSNKAVRESLKELRKNNSFSYASHMVDMFQGRDWGTKIGNLNKEMLCDFMSNAQEAEKFKMDQSNWSQEAIEENKQCIKKHRKEGLGILPFNKILFQSKSADCITIYLHLFEYKNKNIEKNTIDYTHRLVRVLNNSFCYTREELKGFTITVPLDFQKESQIKTTVENLIWGSIRSNQKAKWVSHSKGLSQKFSQNLYKKNTLAIKTFLQLNSHTDKNTNIGVFDIKPKIDSGIGSFKVKSEVIDKEDFVPVWKSKTVYVRPEEYKPERDTTYTSGVEKDGDDSESRYVPYHSVRGHIRRLQKGDITSVRSHFRGNKEHGAIFKNYVLAEPRLLRNNKQI
jgi:hypothetical protein